MHQIFIFSELQVSSMRAVCQSGNGDVKFEENSTPYIVWDNVWSPICGHYFWDNQHGSELFCQKLGYTSGTFERSNQKYSKDAIDVGRCNPGDTLEKCTGGGNGYIVGSDNWCSAGKGVKITISCKGDSTQSSSCKLNSGNDNSTHYINKIMINKICNLNYDDMHLFYISFQFPAHPYGLQRF